jgi:hypothetical protein
VLYISYIQILYYFMQGTLASLDSDIQILESTPPELLRDDRRVCACIYVQMHLYVCGLSSKRILFWVSNKMKCIIKINFIYITLFSNVSILNLKIKYRAHMFLLNSVVSDNYQFSHSIFRLRSQQFFLNNFKEFS